MDIVIYILLYSLKYDITFVENMSGRSSGFLSDFITLINSVFFYIYSQFWTTLLIIIYLYPRVRMHLIKYRAIIVVITSV